MTYRSLAIVLRRRDVGERDRLYTLFTDNSGRVEALAKGARKIGSKLTGAMETPGVVDVLLARGAVFERLAGAVAREAFTGIMLDSQRLEDARAALLLTEALTRPGMRDGRVFTLLASYLRGVNGATPPQFREFALRLLAFLGFTSAGDLQKARGVLQDMLPGRVSAPLHEFVIARLSLGLA